MELSSSTTRPWRLLLPSLWSSLGCPALDNTPCPGLHLRLRSLPNLSPGSLSPGTLRCWGIDIELSVLLLLLQVIFGELVHLLYLCSIFKLGHIKRCRVRPILAIELRLTENDLWEPVTPGVDDLTLRRRLAEHVMSSMLYKICVLISLEVILVIKKPIFGNTMYDMQDTDHSVA